MVLHHQTLLVIHHGWTKLTDLEPTRVGMVMDTFGNIFTVNPSILLNLTLQNISLYHPTGQLVQILISVIRENGDSETNNNQLKTVLIKNAGLVMVSVLTLSLIFLVMVLVVECVVFNNSSGRIVDAQYLQVAKVTVRGVVDLGPVRVVVWPNFWTCSLFHHQEDTDMIFTRS